MCVPEARRVDIVHIQTRVLLSLLKNERSNFRARDTTGRLLKCFNVNRHLIDLEDPLVSYLHMTVAVSEAIAAAGQSLLSNKRR